MTDGIDLIEDARELIISEFSVRDKEVYQFFYDLDEKDRSVMIRTALKLGVTALKTMTTSERVDYIERNFQNMTNDFKSEIRSVFDDDGKVNTVISKYFGEKGRVENFLETKIGKNWEFENMIKDYFGPNGTVIKNIFDPNNEKTPLASMNKNIVDSIIRVREDLGIKKAEEVIKEGTPLKGIDFQDALHPIIGKIAEPFSDKVKNTTSVAGLITRSKKGDFVTELYGNEKKIVIEAKDSRYTSSQIEIEMRGALENRGADYGIYVSKYVEDVPEGVGWFNEYDGKYVVVALASKDDQYFSNKLMEIAYKWARIRALSSDEDTNGKDELPDLNEKLNDVRKSIGKFRVIRTDCTNAENAIYHIRDQLNTIERDINASLDSIMVLL